MIRNRLKQFPFESVHDHKVVSDFIGPILLFGIESEKKANKEMRQSFKMARAEAKLNKKEVLKVAK